MGGGTIWAVVNLSKKITVKWEAKNFGQIGAPGRGGTATGAGRTREAPRAKERPQPGAGT